VTEESREAIEGSRLRPAPGERIAVRKLDYTGRVVYSWTGLRDEAEDAVVIHATFALVAKEPPVVDGVPFCTGDRFTEYYYPDRWYNVFHIADPSGRHKGWYCNVAQPARIDEEGVAFVDMALDLFVHPDGRYTVLDEDEFGLAAEQLYSPEDAARARAGLAQLIDLAERRGLPTPAHEMGDSADDRRG